MSLSHFFSWAGEVVVIFDWARDVMGCVRCSVSCAETLVLIEIIRATTTTAHPFIKIKEGQAGAELCQDQLS